MSPTRRHCRQNRIQRRTTHLDTNRRSVPAPPPLLNRAAGSLSLLAGLRPQRKINHLLNNARVSNTLSASASRLSDFGCTHSSDASAATQMLALLQFQRSTAPFSQLTCRLSALQCNNRGNALSSSPTRGKATSRSCLESVYVAEVFCALFAMSEVPTYNTILSAHLYIP